MTVKDLVEHLQAFEQDKELILTEHMGPDMSLVKTYEDQVNVVLSMVRMPSPAITIEVTTVGCEACGKSGPGMIITTLKATGDVNQNMVLCSDCAGFLASKILG